ncbi:sulfotransferase [Cyanobacterium sp. Dongsha4]|uniref:sulfotransferase family protein n=1 Tax=Cyanobacterium sp. DS4 TaxID=2878255 RepID=UPI002E8244BF|nr:sulfotransferase [Cyanobacterium sp. Dongsha4]WVK99941.1 sulfotransferase [Cyanobacterium sp. Dongsha4]
MTLPNFLIIGAAKSGTTSLYKYLNEHPQVFMSPRKEIHFFCTDNEKVVNLKKLTSLSSITKPVLNIEDYRKYFEQYNPVKHLAIGEVSPGYLISSEIASKNISKYCPKMKLIAILRNPVDRAYSHFVYAQQIGIEKNSDQNTIVDRKMESNYIYFGHDQYFHRYLDPGFYYRNLLPYFNRFDPDQIKIYLFDDLCHNPTLLMKDLLSFIGVDVSFDFSSITSKNNRSGIPKNKGVYHIFWQKNNSLFRNNKLLNLIPSKIKKFSVNLIRSQLDNILLTKPDPISTQLKSKLVDIYHEDILLLQSLLQKDLSHWLE